MTMSDIAYTASAKNHNLSCCCATTKSMMADPAMAPTSPAPCVMLLAISSPSEYGRPVGTVPVLSIRAHKIREMVRVRRYPADRKPTRARRVTRPLHFALTWPTRDFRRLGRLLGANRSTASHTTLMGHDGWRVGGLCGLRRDSSESRLDAP